MTALDGPSWGPKAGGTPKQLVVLCHGLGADGNDLIDLAPSWGSAVPHALFTSPHAPEPFEGAPFGRQWFSLDDRAETAMEAGVRRAAAVLDRYLDDKLAELGLPPDAYALMGFSQGAMTVLYTGLRRSVPPRAILGFSGVLLGGRMLANDLRGHPPVLLVHGEQDQVVPVEASRMAESLLRSHDVPVETVYSRQLAHGIDEAGLTAGALLLQKVFAD